MGNRKTDLKCSHKIIILLWTASCFRFFRRIGFFCIIKAWLYKVPERSTVKSFEFLEKYKFDIPVGILFFIYLNPGVHIFLLFSRISICFYNIGFFCIRINSAGRSKSRKAMLFLLVPIVLPVSPVT